jgi:hypothetical protein
LPKLLKGASRIAEALIQGERPPNMINPEIHGGPKLHPDLYGRGPAVPVTEGGPAIY